MTSVIRSSSVKLISCSRALTRSGLSDVDYALNPYHGCAHGCLYCYAPDVLRCRQGIDWGGWVEARADISRRLKKEIGGVGKAVIGLSTVTDPYQPVEKELELTRACLEVISKSKASLMLMTKSPLVLRDLDLLMQMSGAEICITVTTLDEHISSLFEGKVPGPKSRLLALRELSGAGLKTDAMVSPLLIPGDDANERLMRLIDAISATGCRSVTFDRLRLRETARMRLMRQFSGAENEQEVNEIVSASERFSPRSAIASMIESGDYPEMSFHAFEQAGSRIANGTTSSR